MHTIITAAAPTPEMILLKFVIPSPLPFPCPAFTQGVVRGETFKGYGANAMSRVGRLSLAFNTHFLKDCNFFDVPTERQSTEGRRTDEKMTVTKRNFLSGAISLFGAAALTGCSKKTAAATTEVFEMNRTPSQWRAILSPSQFAVLRGEGTELPRSSPLNDEHRRGIYRCAGCALPVFDSKAKFDSGTGWPSFTAPIKGAVRTKPDPGLFGDRTEVHCRRCGGHLGHVFDDGPPPTGQRWCMNGVAMEFVPA